MRNLTFGQNVRIAPDQPISILYRFPLFLAIFNDFQSEMLPCSISFQSNSLVRFQLTGTITNDTSAHSFSFEIIPYLLCDIPKAL